jgi:mycothiol synthase
VEGSRTYSDAMSDRTRDPTPVRRHVTDPVPRDVTDPVAARGAADAGAAEVDVPPGFTLRRPGWDDLDAVTELYDAASRARLGTVTLRSEDLRMRWLAMEDLDDALLVDHEDAAGPVAYAAFEADLDPWGGELDLHVDGTVHPGWTGRGLGGFLLARAEARARLAGAANGLDRVLLRTSLIDGDDRARSWLAARGFDAVRHLLELRLDLHAPPPAPTWPAGVTCRTFREGDEDALWRAHQASFADVATHLPIERDDLLDDRLRRDPAADPELILLAEHGREVVGFAICRSGTEVAAEDGWVRDLGVVPSWRRRGVGMALLRTAFAAFRARALTGVALEVDDVTLQGAVALYRRAGMRIVRRTDVLERHLDVGADAGG